MKKRCSTIKTCIRANYYGRGMPMATTRGGRHEFRKPGPPHGNEWHESGEEGRGSPPQVGTPVDRRP